MIGLEDGLLGFLDDMRQVVFPPDAPRLDSGDVLESAGSDEDHVVLLEVVALARDIRGQLPPGGQTHQHALRGERVNSKIV